MSKVKIITVNMIGDNHFRRILLRLIIGGFIIIGIIYAYLIISITFNILARRSLGNSSIAFKSNISQLEVTYFSNLSQINRAYATSNGFVNSKNNIFATRSSNYVAIR